ncbi:MAG: zinc metallopeptidase [Clostridium sp.]
MDSYILGQLLVIVSVIITISAQVYVNSSYNKYKRIENSKKLSGFDVAKKILEENGLSNIYVTEVKGNLTDHYDPNRKVVRLSTEVFHGTTIASASVAAHEVGHAIQDKEGYSFMRFRSMMFPLVRISSYGGYLAIVLGIIFGIMDLIWFGIALEVIILIFQLVTLPVEFNASYRAKEELKKYDLLDKYEVEGSDKMLKAAAYTYVASVLTTVLQLLRLIVLFNDRDN